MDAIVMLKNEHRELERLFKQLDKDDLSVVPEMCSSLTLHIAGEEQIFYPEIDRRTEVEADVIAEVLQEHHLSRKRLQEIGSKMEQFKSDVAHG